MIYRFETDKLGILLPIIERALQLPAQRQRQSEFRSIARTLKGLKMIENIAEVSTISLGFRHDGKKQMIVETFGGSVEIVGTPIPGEQP